MLSTRIDCPIALGGPPKRFWLAAKLITATGAAPGRSSSDSIRRPAAGDTARPRKYSPGTYSVLALMACPRTDQVRVCPSKYPESLRAPCRRCKIAGALQPGRDPPPYRLLAVPRLFPQGGVPFPHAAPRCAWRCLSNTSAVVTRPSLRSHHARDRQREFGVLPGFNGQLFAASRRDLVDPRPPIIRRPAPAPSDPAV